MAVIRIGRKRNFAASTAASKNRLALLPLLHGKLHDEDGVLAGQADEECDANLGVDVHVGALHYNRDDSAEDRQRPTMMTAVRLVQLSYWAASTRNTSTMASPKTTIASEPTFFLLEGHAGLLESLTCKTKISTGLSWALGISYLPDMPECLLNVLIINNLGFWNCLGFRASDFGF